MVAGRIEHIVVLMLENRSYDHMLGFVPIEGGNEPGNDEDGNPLQCPESRTVAGSPMTRSWSDGRYASPLDPGHSHAAVMQQLGANPKAEYAPDNRGFIESYLDKAQGKSPELRDRLSWRLRLLGAVTLAVAAAQFPWRFVALGWALVLFAIAVVGFLLVWKATSVSGHVPRTILDSLYRKSKPRFIVILVLALMAVGWLIVGTFVDALWARIVTAVIFAGVGGALVALASKVGRHEIVVNADTVLQRAIMSSFAPDKIKPLTELAQGFATCTSWFCPVPGETWPNRNFVHSGTSDGAVDIEYRLFDDPTIYERLDEHFGDAPDVVPWRIYFKGVPQVLAFPKLWKHLGPEAAPDTRFRTLDRLLEDIEKGDLPRYSFIEPFHGTNIPGTEFAALGTTNSQHSGNNKIALAEYDSEATHEACGKDFLAGMDLVAETYQRLKENSALFSKTVLVITYDEHGGFYDHVHPPTGQAAPLPPKLSKRVFNWLLTWVYGMRAKSYDFTMLGPRVPTIIISPWVAKGAVKRQFDHTSIPATVRKVFGISKVLSPREGAAETFDDLVNASSTLRDGDLPDLAAWIEGRTDAPREAGEPTDDALTRSVDWIGLTLLQYVERVPDRTPAGELDRRVLKKSQRAARQEALSALGRADAGNVDQLAEVHGRIGVVVDGLRRDASV
jgi:phospholipase C